MWFASKNLRRVYRRSLPRRIQEGRDLLLGLALHISLRNFFCVNQAQRQVFRLPGPQRDVLLPGGKNSLSRGPEIVVVGLQLRNRELPVRVRAHHVRCAPARRLIGHTRVRHRPIIRAQNHPAQRGRSFPLRGGRCLAYCGQHQQKNHNQQKCASHSFHPYPCSTREPTWKGRASRLFEASSSSLTLSVKRVRHGELRYAENVLHRQPASSDRSARSKLFAFLRVTLAS